MIRREALYIWKRRLGSKATYQKLINVFEHAGYRNCAEFVRNIESEDENEEDDSSDYDDPIPQPETYPHVKLNPVSSSKQSKCISICDEYVLVNPAAAKGLPEGENNIKNISIIIVHYH